MNRHAMRMASISDIIHDGEDVMTEQRMCRHVASTNRGVLEILQDLNYYTSTMQRKAIIIKGASRQRRRQVA